MDNMAWWTAFGAIAQAAGAAATLLAVIVALLLARSERSLKGKGRVNMMIAVGGDGGLGEYQVHFSLENTGLRPLLWETTTWRVGWLKWGPKCLRYRWALQSDARASPFTTQTIEPAMTGRVGIPVRVIKEARASAEDRFEFFGPAVRVLGYPPVAAFAVVAGRRPIRLKVAEDVASFMRSGEHPSYYEQPS